MNPLSSEKKWALLAVAVYETQLIGVFRALTELHFKPILIKGWSIFRFYDAEVNRITTDIDILFDPSAEHAVSKAIRLIRASVPIDLHFGPRNLDLHAFGDLFDRSYLVDFKGIPIRVLADEDNLRVTAVHWVTDGGVNRERLWDMYYLVKNRKKDFDWERCLDSNGPIRKTWVMAAIATARDHLDLDVSGLPEDARNFQLPGWYKATLEKEWKLGVYPRRMLSTVVIRPKLLAEQIYRRFPPNKIAASVDTETPIDDTSRLPVQIKSLTHKVMPFARGIGRRLTYRWRRHDR